MLRKGGGRCVEVSTGMDWREDSVRGDVREEMGVGLHVWGNLGHCHGNDWDSE